MASPRYVLRDERGFISYRMPKAYIEFAIGKYIELCNAKHIDKQNYFSSGTVKTVPNATA